MNNKDVTAQTVSISSRRNRCRSAEIVAAVAAAVLFVGGCDGGESPQGPYQPGIVYDGGSSYDDGYSYDDGGIAPDRFDPAPAPGPYSPSLNSPFN